MGVRAKSVLLVLMGVISFGCAQDVGDIDRTQPNRVRKTVFEGEWYLARTVIDAPYSTEFTFIGESAELERVRWDIQKDILVAYRVYDRVDGTDKAVEYSEAPYQGSPVVAYPITSHFDIVREYNPATGEQSNVLTENTTDRPWYERDYIRVDWSKNVLPSLTFLVNWAAGSMGSYTTTTNLAYHAEDPKHPHHMVVGTKNTDGSWTDHRDSTAIGGLGSADYLEVTVRTAVEPQYVEIEDYYGSIWRDPACWYYLTADCEHQNIVVRHSFMKVPEKSSYVPLDFPDNEVARDDDGKPFRGLRGADGRVQADPDGASIRFEMFDKFGFFRVERYGYDPVYGELESNRTYLIARYNLLDADGNPSPIVYYKSPDFPEWLNEAGAEIAAQYDEVFKGAVEAQGHTAPEHMFELRDNTGQRIGDMRYSFLYYVPKPTLAGLLGYGPSNSDPITGEILSAAAYVYGGPILQYAGNGQQVVDLINGFLTPEEIGLGKDVQELLQGLKEDQPASKPHAHVSMNELEDFVDEYVNSDRGQAIRKQGLHKLQRPSGWQQGQYEKIRNTAFENALINDEVKLLKGRKVIGPGDPVPEGIKKQMSPASWASRQNREDARARRRVYQKRTMYMAEFVDDAIAGLALDLKDKGYRSEEALRALQIAIIKSTAEHEIGHTLGLRHNFAGSYDAPNFPKKYWDLRGDSPQFPPGALTPQQIAERMQDYRYSSIMEYPARFNADLMGLGHYDVAALMFGYAQHVEVFESAPTDPLADAFVDEFDLRHAFQDQRHYTSLPSAMGGVDKLYGRKFVPYQQLKNQLVGKSDWTLWEVPYRFCSDEYEGATYWCAMYDAGMDQYEIVTDAADRYRNYYFFRAFKRDMAGWDGWSYGWGIYDRYFRHMLNQYQHWAFLGFDETDKWNVWREDPGFYGIEDVQWELARDGGAPLTAAARSSLRFLTEVLAIPRPGAYLYDPDADRYWRWDAQPYPYECGPDAKEKDNPNLDCVDLNVPLGVGRYAFTQYDTSSGYYFYERPLWVGAFEDKVMALEVLSDSTISFLGINTAEDVQSYALGYFLYFPEILTRISGGIIADNVNVFAGSTEFGKYYPPDPFQNELASGRTIVDPDTWSTVQYYAIWFSMAGYAAAFDNTFNDLIHVWYDGADGAQVLPDPDDPSVATWADPITQRTYRAVKHPNEKLFSVGFEMVTRAAALQKQIDDGTGGADTSAYNQILLNYQRELIDLAIGMWELYGKLYF